MILIDLIVDSNVLVDYFGNTSNHEIVAKYFETNYNLWLNPMIIAETYNFLFNRFGLPFALTFNEWLLENPALTIIELAEEDIIKITKQKNTLKDTNLSLTDWSIILHTQEMGIKCVTTDNLLVSFAYGMAQLP
jgi:predicted nucleic acid-binding protein